MSGLVNDTHPLPLSSVDRGLKQNRRPAESTSRKMATPKTASVVNFPSLALFVRTSRSGPRTGFGSLSDGRLSASDFLAMEHLARRRSLLFTRAHYPAGARALSPRVGGSARGDCP